MRTSSSSSSSLLRCSLRSVPWNLPPPSQSLPCVSPSKCITPIRSGSGNGSSRHADPSPSPSDKAAPGAKLWRKELLEQQFKEDAVVVDGGRVSADVDDDPEAFFLDDPSFLVEQEMIKSDEATQSLKRGRKAQDPQRSDKEGSLLGSLVEKLLVADFFFIIFILLWFVAGLAEKAAFDTSSLIDLWLPLWPLLFQPALGFFMAGALWTAASKFLFSK